MRKIALPITMLTLAALTISACTTTTSGIPVTGPTPAATSAATSAPTGAASTSAPAVTSSTPAATSAATDTTTANQANTPAATSTQGTSTTSTPAASSTGGSTANATGTPSVSATGTSDNTSTPSASTTGTPSANTTSTPLAQATGTTAQNTPSAPGASLPAQSVSYIKLSDLFKMRVNASDNTQVGTVSGMLIDQLTNGAVPNSAAPSGGSNGSSTIQVTPVIRYVLVNTQANASTSNSSNAKQVMIPWQAFNFSGAAPNTQTGVLNLSALTLSVGSQVVSGAPVFSQAGSGGFTTPGWDSSISQYWSSQGLSIPATGAANTRNNNAQLLLTEKMGNVQVVGPGSQLIGQVADFLVDVNTGLLQFAVFNGGQTLNNRSFIVPLSYLNWAINTAAAQGADLGKITLNFSPQAFNAAPFFDSLKGITLGQDWPTQIQNFWNTIQPTLTP